METDLWLKLSIMEPDQITFQEDKLGKDNRRYHSYCLHEKNHDLFLNVLLFKNLWQLFIPKIGGLHIRSLPLYVL